MKITENFTYIGTSQNFERDSYATLAEMKAVADKRMPDIFTATCKETGKFYIYNKNNEADETLGKWRELSIDGDDYVTKTYLDTELAKKADTDHTHTTVNGHTVESDVPVDAKFTDTIYDDTDIKAEIAKKADITSIPSKVSELTNDSDYQTAEQISSTVTAEIAKVVANAPENFDTLKEMSDWIAGHEDDASAMNSAISDNKTAIASLQSGKADKSEIPTTVAELTDSADYAKTADLHSHTNKTVLDGITSTKVSNWDSAKTHADSAHAPSNAQANVIETVKVNGTALTPSNKAVDVTVPTTVSELTDSANYAKKTELNNYSYLGSNATRILENDDLNNYITPGIYTCSSISIAKTILNLPTGIDSSFRLEVIINTGDGTNLYGSQELRTNSNKIFIRTIRGTDGWTAWQKLTTIDDTTSSTTSTYSSAKIDEKIAEHALPLLYSTGIIGNTEIEIYKLSNVTYEALGGNNAYNLNLILSTRAGEEIELFCGKNDTGWLLSAIKHSDYSGKILGIYRDGYDVYVKLNIYFNYFRVYHKNGALRSDFAVSNVTSIPDTATEIPITAPGVMDKITSTGSTWSSSKIVSEITNEATTRQNADTALQSALALRKSYDFIVDSNETLLEWAECTNHSMKSVLVKSGEYTLDNKMINLLRAGTKFVFAEDGNKIKSNYFRGICATGDYGAVIIGLNVELSCSINAKDCYAFYEGMICYNCTSTCTSEGNGEGTGFYGCTCSNCTGTGASTSSSKGYGFYNCTCSNCTGSGSTSRSGSGYGFYNCTCSNCTGSSGGAYNNGYGFYNCTCSNCTGSGGGAGSGGGYGFYNCTCSNCTGSGSASYGGGYGFYNCSYCSSCRAGKTASTTATWGGTNTYIDSDSCDYVAS